MYNAMDISVFVFIHVHSASVSQGCSSNVFSKSSARWEYKFRVIA